MKSTKYIGTFRSNEGDVYTLSVVCFGFIQAFFLLTADALRLGRHYQLESIESDNGNKVYVDDILKCGELLTSK
jgi:hypothetical protein